MLMRLDVALGKGSEVAPFPIIGEIVFVLAIENGDALVAKVTQQAGRRAKGSFIVDIQERIGPHRLVRP